MCKIANWGRHWEGLLNSVQLIDVGQEMRKSYDDENDEDDDVMLKQCSHGAPHPPSAFRQKTRGHRLSLTPQPKHAHQGACMCVWSVALKMRAHWRRPARPWGKDGDMASAILHILTPVN